MTVLETLGRIASRYRAHRRRLGTLGEIARLSPEIRKDVGWPAEGREGPRRNARGAWPSPTI